MFAKLFMIFSYFNANEWLDESVVCAQLTKHPLYNAFVNRGCPSEVKIMFAKLFMIFSYFNANEWLDESVVCAQLTKQLH